MSDSWPSEPQGRDLENLTTPGVLKACVVKYDKMVNKKGKVIGRATHAMKGWRESFRVKRMGTSLPLVKGRSLWPFFAID